MKSTLTLNSYGLKPIIALLFLFILPFFSNAQYLETFDTDNKGILIPPCTTNDPTTCTSFDFDGVDWTIGGDLSGLDSDQANEGVHTLGGVLTAPFGDVDEEVCWISPILDISLAGSDVDFHVDVSYTGFDGSDYLDVEYSIDGGAFIVAQPNLVGTGGHTINGSATGSQDDVGIGGGLSGSTLTIRVCADFNSSSETFTVDNVTALDANVVVLPIRLISFKAQELGGAVELSWSSSEEINNDRFEIQHSTNGSNYFTIGEVAGNGTTFEKHDYQFVHETPEQGMNYYRLKQIDYDGRFAHSYVVSQKIRHTGIQFGDIYPNPSQSGLVGLEYQSDQDENLNISVYNLTGQLLIAQTHVITQRAGELNLDFSSLASGVYTVKLDHGEHTNYEKIVLN